MKKKILQKLESWKIEDSVTGIDYIDATNFEIIAEELAILFAIPVVSNNEVAYCHAEKDYRQNECNGYCPHCEYHHSD